MPDLNSLRPDERLELRTAAARLHSEFEGVFGQETIERFLQSSYDQFASRATARNFLGLLAERFARQRLRALTTVEGEGDGGVQWFCSSACMGCGDACPIFPGKRYEDWELYGPAVKPSKRSGRSETTSAGGSPSC
jgi:hypothetical protein